MDEVSQIREKIDLVSFISEYIPLKKMGRNFKANCPFHNEKTPSFVISPERQIWHCFGCGKGGDAFTFLMEYENMEFPEALRALAKKAGIELKESSFRKGQASEKEKLYEINKLALKFYNYILTDHAAGKIALNYLIEKRKLNKGVIKTFELGFAPSSKSALSDYLVNKKNYKAKDLIFAGISIERSGKLYDFFRERIIFPLFDHRNNVTGFSGRALNDLDMPKYINTKETPIYHKGSMFFGLNLSKEEIKEKQDAVIVEGEFDQIALFMEGVKNSVAIKGTAVTSEQVNLLARFTPKITLCLDQDEAGFEATKRSLAVIEKKGLSANIVNLKDAKDPDEAIKKDPNAFKKSLKESVNIYEYLINYYVSKYAKDTVDGKKKITDNLLPLFSQINNEIIKEHYLKKLSVDVDTSIESINKELNKFENKQTEEKVVIAEKDRKTRRALLEEYLLALIIQGKSSKELFLETAKTLSKYKFETPSIQKILEAFSLYFEKNINFDNNLFVNFLSTELIQAFDFCYLYPLPKFSDDDKYNEEVNKVAIELLNIFVRERIKEISAQIHEKENKKETIGVEKLRREFTSLLTLLKK